jgi:hypothetical protein
MTITTIDFDASNVGQVLAPADGFVISLSMTRPPTTHETPNFDIGRGMWTSGYLVLSGEAARAPIVSFQPSTNGGFGQFRAPDGSATIFLDKSIAYAGGLVVQSVPTGSTWRLQLSDVPVLRQERTRPPSKPNGKQPPQHWDSPSPPPDPPEELPRVALLPPPLPRGRATPAAPPPTIVALPKPKRNGKSKRSKGSDVFARVRAMALWLAPGRARRLA